MKKVNIYTGTTFRSPRRSDGWIGYVLEIFIDGKPYTKTDFAKLEGVTKYQAELTAVCEALGRMREPCEITIYTASPYVSSGYNSWVETWIENGWTTARGPVANKEEWIRLVELLKDHEVTMLYEEHSYSNWLASELGRKE